MFFCSPIFAPCLYGAFLIMKKKRYKNVKLTEVFREKPCEICGSHHLTSGHHIKSRGSGGPDITQNLVTLCFKHHEEIHRGLTRFAIKHPLMEEILIQKGWEFCELFKKWRNFGMEKIVDDLLEEERVSGIIH